MLNLEFSIKFEIRILNGDSTLDTSLSGILLTHNQVVDYLYSSVP